MAYPYFGVNGDLNYCYLFMQEVEKCFNAKLYPQTRCKNEVEDFLECHNRQKHVLTALNLESSIEEGQRSNDERHKRECAPLQLGE